jgi:hypothetical protein
VRRLGRVRFSWVEYPDGCKDLNEVLTKLGAERATEILSQENPLHLRRKFFQSSSSALALDGKPSPERIGLASHTGFRCEI